MLWQFNYHSITAECAVNGLGFELLAGSKSSKAIQAQASALHDAIKIWPDNILKLKSASMLFSRPAELQYLMDPREQLSWAVFKKIHSTLHVPKIFPTAGASSF